MKPSDSKLVKIGETPLPAAKKANAKASRSNKQTKLPKTDTAAANDVNSDPSIANTDAKTRSKSTMGAVKRSTDDRNECEAASKKTLEKPSGKKVKTKGPSKPNVRTAIRQQPPARTLSITDPTAAETTAESLLFLDTSLGAESTQATEGTQRSFFSENLASSEGTSPPSTLSVNSSSSVTRNQSVNQSSDRIAIFIDGSNLFYAASHLNIEVDYRRLLASLVRGRRLLRAYFYTGVDPQNEKQRGFLLWLNRHGHRVVSKELTNLPDGSRKANMHVEMAVDMMRIAEYCPNVTLLGGDGNLAYALQVLSQRGTFIEVVSLQSMTSDSLIDLADSYTDLASLRDDIKR